MNIVIVGLGGIGSILSDNISRYLNYTNIENINITLVDGDSYELKNSERQTFTRLGNKGEVKCSELAYKFENIKYRR